MKHTFTLLLAFAVCSSIMQASEEKLLSPRTPELEELTPQNLELRLQKHAKALAMHAEQLQKLELATNTHVNNIATEMAQITKKFETLLSNLKDGVDDKQSLIDIEQRLRNLEEQLRTDSNVSANDQTSQQDTTQAQLTTRVAALEQKNKNAEIARKKSLGRARTFFAILATSGATYYVATRTQRGQQATKVVCDQASGIWSKISQRVMGLFAGATLAAPIVIEAIEPQLTATAPEIRIAVQLPTDGSDSQVHLAILETPADTAQLEDHV